ncbi:MAG TPA: hypothetical protein VFV51_01820 [Vicinamibacterales bacterium]|nr:hypothetical protein [Vicinamibacterales bacterium]
MTPTRAQELAVLRSVTYAAMFDYPLTLEQLHASLIEVRADAGTVASWWRNSELLQAAIDHQDGWYFPSGRGDLIRTRARREAVSRRLLDRDRAILSFVGAMPFVRMVALSGSLAHLNAEQSADLDLFVITAPRHVWSVTVTLLVIARLCGWRKRLCLNYVISESALQVEPADLFSANQIIHLRPLTGGALFSRFVAANTFVGRCYPNFTPPVADGERASLSQRLLERLLSIGIAPALERAARVLYGWHLNRRSSRWQSRDQVRLEPECLKLHTSSHRAAALERYEAAVAAALQAGDARHTIAS